MPSNMSNKTRRPHTKSRNGCLRCKSQRRKCDERLPSCSRCADLHIKCLYTKARHESEPLANAESPRPHRNALISILEHRPTDDVNEPAGDVNSPSTSTTLNEEGPLGLTTPMESSFAPRHSSPLDMKHQKEALQDSAIIPTLDARDLELLTHYLTHTSQTIPYDKADLYALHIGIPNLAFGSKPLMSSLLALAAVCKCHDLLPAGPSASKHSDLPLGQIQGLLGLAERHHSSSLHQIQKVIGTRRYDTVLANATLMTLYGSAMHCVRIRLFDLHEEGRLGGPLPGGSVPAAHSPWISLIRAVHCAFVGLRADGGVDGIENSASPVSLATDAESESDVFDQLGEVQYSQDGPAETTRRLFLPIVTATIHDAMARLRTRVQRAKGESSSATALDIDACTGALDILESIVAENFASGIDSTNTAESTVEATETATETTGDCFDGRLVLVAPWLRAYTARVTSNYGTANGSSFDRGLSEVFRSGPLRRKIMAFLNRVEADYFRLVQEILERMTLPDIEQTEPHLQKETAASRSAMDIFAHWIVLVCLLDGVWWVGGIGMWELGRVVRYMKGLDDGEGEPEKEAWWPASMYAIRTELAKQRL